MNMKLADARREEGFTLIELLVVVIIIGILAAIAIPVFLAQRERAWRSTAQSDLRNGAVALETYYTDEGGYGGDPAAGTGAFDQDEIGFNPSENVTHWAVYATGDNADQAYCMAASHDNHDEVWYLGSAGTLADLYADGCPAVDDAGVTDPAP